MGTYNLREISHFLNTMDFPVGNTVCVSKVLGCQSKLRLCHCFDSWLWKGDDSIWPAYVANGWQKTHQLENNFVHVVLFGWMSYGLDTLDELWFVSPEMASRMPGLSQEGCPWCHCTEATSSIPIRQSLSNICLLGSCRTCGGSFRAGMKQGKSKDCPVMRNHQVGQASTDVGLIGGTSVHWFSDALPNMQNVISAGRKEQKWPLRSSLQRKESRLQVNGVSTWFFSMKTGASTGRFVSPAGQSSTSFASLQNRWERWGGHTPSMPTTDAITKRLGWGDESVLSHFGFCRQAVLKLRWD